MRIKTKRQKKKAKAKELPPWAWKVQPHTYAERASGGKWLPYKWLIPVGEAIADTVAKDGGRLLLNGPPRHGKSLLTSVWTALWFLETWPHKRVIIASYGNTLAVEFGRIVRDEIRGNPLISIKLREDADAAGKFLTPEGGGVLCAGVNSPIIGFGFDLGIVDDPVKSRKEAYSPTYRRQTSEWFDTTFMSRAEPGASVLVTMQRWHKKDISHHVKTKDGWDVITAQAIADEDNPRLYQKKGEPLCPERYSLKALEQIKKDMGVNWGPLYQQSPMEQAVGAVYDSYSDANINDEIRLDKSKPLCLCVDFNINPGMHGEIGHYDGIDDMFTVPYEIFGHGMSLQKLLTAFIAFYKEVGPFPSVKVYGDPAGGSRGIESGITRIDVIKQALEAADINVELYFARSHPSPIDLANSVNEALCDFDKTRHVRVHSRCERLHTDFENVVWNDQGTNVDKGDQQITHASEAFSHWVYTVRRVRAPDALDGPGEGARIILG